jgi:1,4-dihydroxy-2-naphthoyl-CoA hydrolase
MNEDPNAFLHTTMPFMAVIGAETVRADPSEVVLKLDWDASRCTAGGILHGGALMSLADGAGGWCAFLNLPSGANTTTLESKTNLLRAVREGTVTAAARPLHIGRSVIVVDTELRDNADRLVARTTQTQMVLGAS